MSKLVRGHRDKVQQFMTITGSSEKLALQALKSCDWHLEGAFDVFYSQPQVKSYADTRLVEELYKRYKGKCYNSIKKLNVFYHELVVAILAERTFCSYPYVDMILADGITLLCNDLQVDPQDVVMLVLSWHMKAATMCEFSKQEFIGGLQALGIDSLEKFRDRMQFMRSELKDDQKFREIYIFAFGWAKEKGQKSLALDTAIGMWQLLFAEKQWPLVDHWCQFLQKVTDSVAKHQLIHSCMNFDSLCQRSEVKPELLRHRHMLALPQPQAKARHNKAISRDTWSQLLEFARMVDPTLSNYDAEGAWPYLIDEFVEYLNENGIIRKGQLNDWSQKY
ncbi:hypothetical protein RHGRI_009328 [Rhododendron griersonianum]|uniref:Defective in cullin neddylation protein n=1 Tax=Rhododendron griersonianum TaxID=479676 RepID=A0AAV6KEY4_9ERIC|nr:hypothetical protein RHGRI_009328 [Rhododendron griersonianum]